MPDPDPGSYPLRYNFWSRLPAIADVPLAIRWWRGPTIAATTSSGPMPTSSAVTRPMIGSEQRVTLLSQPRQVVNRERETQR